MISHDTLALQAKRSGERVGARVSGGKGEGQWALQDYVTS